MANNKIGDSDINCQIKRTDYFVDCDTPTTTNGDLSTSESHKFFHRILKYLRRSTARIKQSKKKKCDTRKRSVSTCKSEEKISVYTSLSSILNNVIKSNADVAAVKRKMVDAITSTTRTSNVFDKVTHENLSGTTEHFVRGTSYRYAEYAAKDLDKAVSERGCGPLCIGIGTQNDTVDGGFTLEISPDGFAEACEKRRHTDFILDKIAKVSDALTEKARLASAKEQAASILASIPVTPMKYEREEQTFEITKPLISSIIYAEEKPTAVAKEKPIAIAEEKPTVTLEEKSTVTLEEKPTTIAIATSTIIMQPKIHTEILESSLNHFTPTSRDFSVSLNKSLMNASDIQIEPSIEDLKEPEHTRTVSVTYPERDDLRDTAVTVVAKKNKEEKEELPKKSSLRRMLDKHVFTDKTSDAAENCVIINCIPKLKKKRPKSLDRPSDVQTDALRQKVVKDVDSSVKPSKMKKELAQAKDILQEPVPYKKPKYRAKYRIDTSYMMKKEEKPQLKKVPKDFDEISKYACLISLPEIRKSSKVFDERLTRVHKDCRILSEPTRYCKDLVSSDICLGRPKYCDIWTTPCLSSENILNCALPQDSCATKYRASCHLLVDSRSSSRYCNINSDCTKHRVTFENSCKSDAKYCYSHLNNIDNARMRYYHCNDICPVWNNNQQCERDQSCYWTKGNLYFTHPWTSEHLLRYN